MPPSVLFFCFMYEQRKFTEISKEKGAMKKKVDVIIPVYKPDERFAKLMTRLQRQSYPIHRIILMNTEEEYWKPQYIEDMPNVEVHHLTKAEFDHGGTRKAAAAMSKADIFVCMTQDAVPYDTKLVEHLVSCFEFEGVKAAYARQLPAYDCGTMERYTREFNYPDRSFVKSSSDLEKMGIKTYFCSNVCAAYEKSAYDELGGFISRAIFNEDMIYAAKVIQAGYKIAYCAEACVIHSHNYNCRQQFHRNFDLGVSQAENPEVFAEVPSEGEGMKLVRQSAGYAWSLRRPDLLVSLFLQSGFKYMGYFLGKHYQKLPKSIVLRCTMNREYWTFQG